MYQPTGTPSMRSRLNARVTFSYQIPGGGYRCIFEREGFQPTVARFPSLNDVERACDAYLADGGSLAAALKAGDYAAGDVRTMLIERQP